MDREAWRATIHGVAKSRTRLSDWTESSGTCKGKWQWRHYFMTTRMGKIKENDKRWWGWTETGTLLHCWWKCEMVFLWKIILQLLQRLNQTVAIWPRGFTSGYVPKRNIHTQTSTWLFTAALCTITKKVQRNYASIIWWIFKTWFSSVQFSRSVVSDSLQPHESQHARPPCPLPIPRVHSNSRPLKHGIYIQRNVIWQQKAV